jgi:hypothetical protein
MVAKVKPINIDMKALEESSRPKSASFDTTRLKDREAEVANLSAVRAKELADMRDKPSSRSTSAPKESFSQAFAAARKRGEKTFKWGTGTYGTQMKGETSSAKPAKPQGGTSAPAGRSDLKEQFASPRRDVVGVRPNKPPALIAARPAPAPIMMRGVSQTSMTRAPAKSDSTAAPAKAAPAKAAPAKAAPAKSAAPQFPGIMQQQPPSLLRRSNMGKVISSSGSGYGSFKNK